jgi:tetratricopeptide (TPR) repeat protein
VSLAFVRLIYDWDWAGAASGFDAALTLDPNYAHGYHWRSHYFMAMGRTNESLADARQAHTKEPFDFIINIHLGWHYLFAHDYGRALAQLERTKELFPRNPLSHRYLGLVYERMGRYDKAIAAFTNAVQLSKENSIMLGGLGYTYAVKGETNKAWAVLSQLERLAATKYVSPYYRALIYVGLKDHPQAFDWLDHALAERSDALIYLKQDPWLEPLRNEARFDRLIQQVGLPK